jgi:hypothetical protein
MIGCAVPTRPSDPPIADYDRFTYGTGSEAPTIHWEDFQKVYRLHADLWAMALKCDLVRYGNLMFESAGGHTNFQGTYSALGESTDFPGNSQHDSYFHDNRPRHARLYQHFAQTNLAYFLCLLDGAVENLAGGGCGAVRHDRSSDADGICSGAVSGGPRASHHAASHRGVARAVARPARTESGALGTEASFPDPETFPPIGCG